MTIRDNFEQFVEDRFGFPASALVEKRTVDIEGVEGYTGMPSAEADLSLSCMLMSWKAAKQDNWIPSGGDYDMNIHSNPDALAWAKFFLETFPRCGVDEETMMGWFANAMMARHDYDQGVSES